MVNFPVYYSPTHQRHAPANSPEIAGRLAELMAAIVEAGMAPQTPRDFGLEPIEAVHSEALIAFLQTAYRRFAQLKTGPRPAVPDSFAVRELSGVVPPGIWGQLGYYCSDDLTPVMEKTWEAAYWSAQVALTGAAAIERGASIAYGMCRPPGHHAHRDMYGGFCYLNNAAIAAQWLTARGRRVAILDIDYHHGNGTQAIFYDRADVFFASIHADPAEEYPYYCGYDDEKGRGEGWGYTLNLPLPSGTGEVDYLATFACAVAAVRGFFPDVVIISLGFDTLAGDPEGEFRLEPATFRPIGRHLRDLETPLLLIQEGGYLLPALRPALSNLINGLSGE